MLALALTCGDPSGIGIEVALKAWQKRHLLDVPVFFIIADPEIIAKRAQFLGLDISVRVSTPEDAVINFKDFLPVIPLKNKQIDMAGRPQKNNAAGIIESIETAVELVFAKRASAIVTNPIAKKNLYEAGFKFPGHTEFLAALSLQKTERYMKPVMMLAGPELKTVPVTVHIALQQVHTQLTKELIIEVATICHYDLIKKFGIINPRIAVAGLNPHAGELGAMGMEERDIILPAIEILRQKNINVSGPLPSDTMFHQRARSQYDVALCMYHDQALIPVKTIGFDETVNVTLGLPFIRTSPDHGTAFDIAQKNVAIPNSLIAALKLADKLSKSYETKII